MVYIDTEGSFLIERVADLAAAAVNHCSLLVEDQEQREAMETFRVDSILSNMFVVIMRPYSRQSCRSGYSSAWSLSGPLS